MNETVRRVKKSVFPFVGKVSNTLLSFAKYKSLVTRRSVETNEINKSILRMMLGTVIGTKGRRENILSLIQTLNTTNDMAAAAANMTTFNRMLTMVFFLFPLKSIDKELESNIERSTEKDFHSTWK